MDIFEDVDALPPESIDLIATRLEERAKMAPFAKMRDHYFDLMALATDATILELGGGTGIVGRAYAGRKGFRGRYVVTDLSQKLIDAGREIAEADGLSDRMDFRVGNAITGEGLGDATCDAVILHTLLSHVPDPERAIRTAVRLGRPGTVIALFDADYASLLISTTDERRDAAVLDAFRDRIVAQPTIMRRIPQIAGAVGLERIAARSDILAEIGTSEFFLNLARVMANLLVSMSAIEQDEAAAWNADVEELNARDEFFGMCPYFTYLYRVP